MMYDSDIVTGRSRTVQDDFEKLEGQLRRPTCSIDIIIHVWAVPARCEKKSTNGSKVLAVRSAAVLS